MRRGRSRKGAPKADKRTVVPPYDPADLARAIESAGGTETNPPPFDPNAYAKIVDADIKAATMKHRDTPKTMTAAEPLSSAVEHEIETLAREMYASYLASEFPEALMLAEHVVEKEPNHALAQAVVARCRAVIGDATRSSIVPSSILRVRIGVGVAHGELDGLPVDARSMIVLRHVDGMTDAASIADLAGISRHEALEHLHALLEAGVVELVA